jgi:hypothetical protein
MAKIDISTISGTYIRQILPTVESEKTLSRQPSIVSLQLSFKFVQNLPSKCGKLRVLNDAVIADYIFCVSFTQRKVDFYDIVEKKYGVITRNSKYIDSCEQLQEALDFVPDSRGWRQERR